MHSIGATNFCFVCCLTFVLLLGTTQESIAASTFTELGTSILGGVNYNARSASLADIDVFVGQSNTSGASGDVLQGNGLGGFTNSSLAVGLNDPGFHQNVAWADIDNDRDLDLIMGMEGPEKHEIYLQGSSGSFTPVGATVGFQEYFGTKAICRCTSASESPQKSTNCGSFGPTEPTRCCSTSRSTSISMSQRQVTLTEMAMSTRTIWRSGKTTLV